MKGRWSFVGKKHRLKIDSDLWQITQQYVKDQLAILQRHNDAPDPPMTQAEFEDLAYDVARHPQEIRNLQAQAARKKAREVKKEEREAKKLAREVRAIEKRNHWMNVVGKPPQKTLAKCLYRFPRTIRRGSSFPQIIEKNTMD